MSLTSSYLYFPFLISEKKAEPNQSQGNTTSSHQSQESNPDFPTHILGLVSLHQTVLLKTVYPPIVKRQWWQIQASSTLQ